MRQSQGWYECNSLIFSKYYRILAVSNCKIIMLDRRCLTSLRHNLAELSKQTPNSRFRKGNPVETTGHLRQQFFLLAFRCFAVFDFHNPDRGRIIRESSGCQRVRAACQAILFLRVPIEPFVRLADGSCVAGARCCSDNDTADREDLINNRSAGWSARASTRRAPYGVVGGFQIGRASCRERV